MNNQKYYLIYQLDKNEPVWETSDDCKSLKEDAEDIIEMEGRIVATNIYRTDI